MTADTTKPITMTAVVDRWVMYTDASGNERPAHVVRETKIDGVTVLGVEAAGPGLVWVPIDRVIRSAATQLELVPPDALNDLAGAWPGDETDEELASAMREWDGHRAELDAERARAEAAEAQLAALREAAREMEGRAGTAYEFASDSYPEDEEGWFLAAEKALAVALSASAAAAEAYTRHVRAEALREAARTIDTWEASDDRRANGYQEAADHLRGEAERIDGERKDGAE